MQLFLDILMNVIFPVFFIMGIGVIMQRIFSLDLYTLSKVTMYYLLPVVGFVNIYESQINGAVFAKIIGFQLLLSVCLMMYSGITAKLFRLDNGMTANYKNSIVLMNSGNYGIPVSQFIFYANPLGMSIQIIVMIIQNFLTYTYGLMNAVTVRASGLAVMKEFLKLPMLYALLLGVLFQTFHITLPTFIWEPIQQISNAFLAIALLALGAQVAYIQLRKFDMILIFSCFGRLIVSPIVALSLLLLFGMDGTIAKALFIASSFPSSRNSAQLALEYNIHPEHAGQTVFVTTILSAVTVTFVVYLANVIF